MSGISSGKKWDPPKLIQSFVSIATGLLVAADVMSLRVPLYFFGQATDRVGDVFHSVARLVRHGLSDIFDQIETGSITVSDALYLALTAVLIGAGFVFLRNTLGALAKARPGRWVPLPRLGWRRAVLALLALGGGIAFVWQYGDLPWLAGQLVRSLWLAAKAAYGNRDAVWQAVQAIHENKEMIAQVAKGIVSAIATYVTLEVARVAVDFVLSIIHFASPVVLPVARYGYAGYKYMRPWLPHFGPTRRQIDWLHSAGSVAAGALFGFTNLSFPQIPDGLWAASLPGLILFAGQRPNLIFAIGNVGSHMTRYLIHYLRIATEYTHAHPRAALGIAGAAMVGGAIAAALDTSGPLLGVGIIWGTLKAGYSAVVVASIIAAVRGSVKIITHVRQTGSAVATGANAARQKIAAVSSWLTSLCRNLANTWSVRPTQESTPGYRLISAA